MKKLIFLKIFFFSFIVFVMLNGCKKEIGEKLNTSWENENVKEFKISAKQFEFVPDILNVEKGDKVRLLVKSKDVTHGFTIQGYNINERLDPGKEVIIEFIAYKQGTFEFFCSEFCGKGHYTMKGTLIVN